MAQDGGIRNQTPVDAAVVIVGAGFSGVGMAIRLFQAGIHDVLLLEKAPAAGGTWRDNQYPGCACDVQSHMYSFSFELNPDWSRTFAGHAEIWAYLERCIDKYGVRPHIRFGTTVTGAEFDEQSETWRVLVAGGPALTCRAVVFAMGPLHRPRYPELPGLASFAGTTFHSSTWDHDYDLAGKRVAVVGAGASAIQFVPEIAGKVARLDLYQRSPSWVLPKADRSIGERERALYRRWPMVHRLRRWVLYWAMEARLPGFTGGQWLMRLPERWSRRHLRRAIADPELRRKVTPTYRMGCKRVLISNDYYPALARDNVEVITDAIEQVRPEGIVAGGRLREVDAVIFSTGFHVTDAMDGFGLVGRDGLTLPEAWPEGMEAYLGTVVAGFPNAFWLLGPNTGLGHNSVVFMAEAQMRYVVQALRLLARHRAGTLEVRPQVQRAFNERIQGQLARAVWTTGGCHRSWYLDGNGVNRALWPTYSYRYWLRTRRLDPADFELASRAVPAAEREPAAR